MKVGLHTRLKPGVEERYEQYHRNVYIKCADFDRALAELAGDPVNQRWQAEMAPMMAVTTDFSGNNSDRMPVIFEL